MRRAPSSIFWSTTRPCAKSAGARFLRPRWTLSSAGSRGDDGLPCDGCFVAWPRLPGCDETMTNGRDHQMKTALAMIALMLAAAANAGTAKLAEGSKLWIEGKSTLHAWESTATSLDAAVSAEGQSLSEAVGKQA